MRSRCKVLSTQYVYYFRVYQRQRTLHGIGVITKLYFAIFVAAIFVAFKEAMTFNLAHRSSKVMDFGTNRKCIYMYIYIFLFVVNSNLSEHFDGQVWNTGHWCGNFFH